MNVLAYEKAFRVLRDCAADRRTIVGSDLAKLIGLSETREEFVEIVDKIGHDCVVMKRPILTALVVQGTKGMPPPRFFETFYSSKIAAASRGTKMSIWKHKVEEVYDYYSQK